MDNQLQSISKIFTERLYRIPDYQRGYAWTEKQLKDFWNDIMQLEDDKNHYVGVLTLEKVPKETCSKWTDDDWIIVSKSFEPYYVVDGQQRLTTTIILIQAITEIIPSDEKLNYSTIDEIRKRYIFDSKDGGISRSYIFGYEKDNPSYEFLKTRIFLENSSSGYLKEETIYTHNLLYAKEYFKERLQELSKEAVELVFRKITQSLLFNIYSITSDIDVFIAFETMNNRGKPLSNLELLKNRLIYLSTKFEADENERNQLRKRINDSWKAVYHFLGRNKERPLKDDFFLMNHYMIYFGEEVDVAEDFSPMKARRINNFYRDNYEVFLLEKKFNLKNLYESSDSEDGKLTIKDVNNYIESLQKSVEIWFNIYNPTLSNDYEDDEKALLEKLFRIGLNHFAPLLLSCYLKKPNKNLRLKLLTTLERFGFVVHIYSHRYVIPLWDLNLFALRVTNGTLSVAELEKQLAERTNLIVNDKDFISDVTKKFSNEGFYEWSGIRYFLFEYDLSLKGSSKTKKIKIDWRSFNSEQEDFVTVEHIYPQTARENCWKKDFNKYPLKQRKILNNSLGNLLPLSKPKNSSLQNKCFHLKVDNDKNQIGYRFGSYSENAISKLESWTPKDILNRGLILLDFMEKRWSIPLGTKEQKIKILNLDFLEVQ
ncbi:DUF262 domain-containing protein [Paracnuella aquatica]|uniref:DUF262 domain-containing protein n=1 Tax=Paracnuella aquatica TaxID=2268757 RepID=UPI000DEEF8B7|nr:DUF262 domain-containing protein [Paracnuella aquatica]RPD45102.1 DUF262 domain-containing protein [Paracnuella aquatica]